jgi:hypothetical protein
VSPDDLISELAVRDNSIFWHVFKPGSCNCNFSASIDETRMRKHVVNNAVFVIIVLNV